MEIREKKKTGPKPNPDTRKNIVQVGLKMFHEEGYSATGIQGIVEQAGVPKGSFYGYFKSKEEFGREVIDAYSERGLIKLKEILKDTRKSPLKRLEAYFDDRIEAFERLNFTKGCMFGNFSSEVADHSPMIRENLTEQFSAWSRIFEECIREAQERNEVSDAIHPASIANFLFNSWEGALLRMRAEKSKKPLLEFKRFIFGKVLV